jgi:bacillithiol biosynthesis deacetylase BshB1
MILDILAFAAHPDDVELSCSGTLLKHIAAGYKVGIIDLTRGELGSRGSAEIRDQESADASRLMGLSIRENLGFRDGFFLNDELHQMKIIEKIRQYQPEKVLCNAISDRHPDHGKGSELVSVSCFLSGLIKIETGQPAWRPKAVYHYIQDYYHPADFVVDISSYMQRKLEVIQCFKSQFFNPNSTLPETPISSKSFLDFIESRAREMGRPAGFEYGEGFTVERNIGIDSFFDIV